MPIVDIQSSIISSVPGLDISFPDNLRILCTIVEDNIMPLNEDCLKHIGCINKSIKKDYYGNLIAPENTHTGYLTPLMLKEEGTTVRNVPNYYKDYLTDE